MRLAAYAGTSAALAAGCLIKAFSQRPNYYSATVYLSQSNACVLILTNLALVCTVSFIYGLQRLLYGPLRAIEIEQLTEKAWYAVLDTLLAMPSLRDDVGGWLLITFVLLLAGKVWAWIAEGRVDILEQQPPANPKLFHARLSASLVMSIAFDILMCHYCFKSVLDDPRPGMMVIFTFEYGILAIFSIFTGCRYLLAIYEARVVALQTRQKIDERKAEIRMERLRALVDASEDVARLVEPTDDDVDENEIDVPGWEEKRRWLFGLEIATDAIKLFIYTVFFTISMTFIGIPMHVMRDVYMTVAAFTKRIQDYHNYRRATYDMNNRYPDANAQELSNENTCIVCREAMIPWETTAQEEGQPPRTTINEGLRAKKLPCGHILHLRCLKAWLERQQSCPTCRRPVVTAPGALGANQNNAGNRGGGLGGLFQGAGQQNNAQHGQNNAAAQHDQQPRRNRMRWLQMGPVRIGFYNGPAQQVQAALRAQENAQAAAIEPGTGITHNAIQQMAAQDHLRAAELRLLHEAHNLDVDRAQLVHLRALEAELERLRGLRINPGQTAQSTLASLGQQPQTGLPPLPGVRQVEAMHTYQPATAATAPPLPEGMRLPQGWTLTPLQRVGGFNQQPHQPMPQVMHMPPGFPVFPGMFPPQQFGQVPHPTQAPAPGLQDQTGNGPARQASPAPTNTGPAAAPEPTRTVPEPTRAVPAAAPEAPVAQSQPSNGTAPNGGSTQAMPTWSFPESSTEASKERSQPETASMASDQTAEQITDHEGESSKGKAKSVELEDAPDSEA